MRWPSLETDFWDLESAEDRAAESPDSFWIPARVDREAVQPGNLVKLLFRIEAEQPDGSAAVFVERMWVLVTERLDGACVGLLANQPGSFDPADGVYLARGAEVPFRPEHVIDIAEAPGEYIEEMRGITPTRRWPRS